MFLFFDVLAIVLEGMLASFFDGLLPFVNQLVNMLGALTLVLDPRTASIASEAPEAVSSEVICCALQDQEIADPEQL